MTFVWKHYWQEKRKRRKRGEIEGKVLKQVKIKSELDTDTNLHKNSAGSLLAHELKSFEIL